VTEEEALLRAIDASPADQLPRLVYADWLDDRGDPRAEFVRLACQQVAAARRLAELRAALPPGWVDRVEPLRHLVVIYRMPLLGAEVGGAAIRELRVRDGERVAAGQSLFVVETDMAFIELPAEWDGVFVLALAGVGEVVPVGGPLALLLRS
jgi:uncharacterized protein (TIGR02996 family)